jgi:hypothetical protein
MERPLHEAVEQQIEALRQEGEANFGRGYLKGREDQQNEDRYYIDRVAELSRLLASAEDEIKRLRARS